MSNCAKKNLTFNSYEELKARGCKIDVRTLSQMKKLDTKKCFKQFIEIEREARMKHQAGEDEEAFILYSRAMEIFRLINDKIKNDDAFKRSWDGNTFYEISSRMAMDFENLSDELRLRFSQAVKVTEMAVLPSPPAGVADFMDDEYAKPKEIVRFVEKGKDALVLDYRSNQGKSLEYKETRGSMQVVNIERESIVLGSLLHSIIKAQDISVRPILQKISHFDIVIFVCDSGDITKQKGSKTKILHEALTAYNLYNKLKRPPMIMDGGFENWENTYPYYVTKRPDIPKFEKTFDEQFSTWIEESRQTNQLQIHYPDLAGISGIPKSDPPRKIYNNRKGSAEEYRNNSNVSYPSNELKQQPSADVRKTSFGILPNSDYLENRTSQIEPFNRDEGKGQNYNKPTIPSVDRTKKPLDFGQTHKQLHPSIGKYTDEAPSNQSEVFYNKENKAPGSVPKRSALPQVLGGARVAVITDEAPTPASTTTVTLQPPPRPPIPDRTTKNNAEKPHQQQLDYFKSSFLMARSKIKEDSMCKKFATKQGYTGLINMGNTCFMNATLQALFHTPGFSHLFRNPNMANLINTQNTLGTRGIISGCFAALLDLVWSGEFSAIRPYFFLSIFAQRVNSALADRQQHDAQEFQIYLLDALHEDTNRVDKRCPFEQNYTNSNLLESSQDFFERSRKFSSSPVNDIFNLTTVSTLQCKTCKATSVRFEGLNQISVELPNHGKSLRLKDCLNAHFSTTVLDSLWDCPACKSRQSATRSTKIWNTPKVLIIHTKRFSLSAGQFVKNEAEVSFEINDFDMAQYLHAKAPPCKTHYNLYAITNHTGNLNSGHYTSCVKNLASDEREWVHFDDERSSRWNTPSTSSKQAFLLYYSLNIDGSETGKG